MLKNHDLFGNERPFKMSEYSLPSESELQTQLEHVRKMLANQELAFYVHLPEAFQNVEIPPDFADNYNLAITKLREILRLMQEAESPSLEESLNIAVDTYHEQNPYDYEGLEVLGINGNLLVSIYNGRELALQVFLTRNGDEWCINQLMTHFRLYGYCVEIRDNLEGNQAIVLHPQTYDLGVVPQVRDRNALAAIKIPTERYPEWNIRLFNLFQMVDGDQVLEYYDYFTIAPEKSRTVKIFKDNIPTEQLFARQTSDGIQLDLSVTSYTEYPKGIEQTQSRYLAETSDLPIDAAAIILKNLVAMPDNLHSKVSVLRGESQEMPMSSRVEDNNCDYIRTFEVRFNESSTIDSIQIDGKTYLKGEFSVYLSEDGYYIFAIESTGQVIGINFTPDYTMQVARKPLKPVFRIANENVGPLLSKKWGLVQTVSLN